MYLSPRPIEDVQKDAALREAWYAERTLLNIFDDKPADILAFIRECESADLHQFKTVYGLPQEIEIFRAILAHPKCDRATALNIFASCDPEYFDRQITAGIRFADMEDEEDRVTYQILMEAFSRLKTRETWRGRFRIDAAKGWAKRPKTFPGNLRNFRLSETALRPTNNEEPPSAIIYEYAVIALSFDTWLHRV